MTILWNLKLFPNNNLHLARLTFSFIFLKIKGLIDFLAMKKMILMVVYSIIYFTLFVKYFKTPNEKH